LGTKRARFSHVPAAFMGMRYPICFQDLNRNPPLISASVGITDT
jgi:hypothetical protein